MGFWGWGEGADRGPKGGRDRRVEEGECGVGGREREMEKKISK